MVDGSVVIDTKLDDSGVKKGINNLKSGFSKIGSIAGSALKGVAVATGIATTAVAGLVTASVNAYAEYEQLVGGVNTLFKNSSEKLQMYANEAYKTAGLSANEYMSTVTSFSASLLQSLSGDTEKAAEQANSAIIDMSDNANKMGTSMEMIQNAYQGFAKQNYTMLDNLKLGYGGTKTEMERLLSDAQKLSGIKYDISNFSDITQAIHVIQTEMGITGTTAKEASTTIEGSINSVKSAWNNLLVGITNPDADWDMLIDGLVDTVTKAGENILPAVKTALIGVSALIRDLFPIIAQEIPLLISDILPNLVKCGVKIVSSLIEGVQQNLPALMDSAIQIIMTLATALMDMLPQILQAGITILIELTKGIAEMLPELVPMAIDCIVTLVETLLDNIDLLIDAGIQLILALADGLIDALPRLIEKIPVIIEKLLNAIVNNLPKIIEMGIKLIIKLAEGLIKAIPQLVSKIPQIISALVSALGQGLSKIGEVGLNLIKGLWNGISNATSWLWNKISGFCSGILDKIKGFFGIHSPSKVFADEIGQYLGLGLGEGFDDSLSSVYKDMQKAVEHENAKLTSNLTSLHQIQVSNEDNRQSRLESIDNNKEIQVNSTIKVDSKVLANAVNKVNTKQKLAYGIA